MNEWYFKFTFEPVERNILHILIALLLFQHYYTYIINK